MPGLTTHLMAASSIADLTSASSGLSCNCTLANIEGLNRFSKNMQGFGSKNDFLGCSMLFENRTSGDDNLSLGYFRKARNAIITATAAAGDSIRTSTVQERHTSQNGTILSVFPTDEASPNDKTRSTYIKGNEKDGPGADWLQIGGLVGDGMLYSERFLIRCYEVGTNRRASIETIANLLQEVACNHARSVGFSTDGFATTPSMRKRHLIWVTTRMHIEVDNYPAWGDTVEIDTWFQGEGRVGTRRDWVIKKASSREVIGRATSTWVMMNQDTRRLSRITDDIRAEYMAYSPRPPRWAFLSEHNDSTKKIPKLESAQHAKTGLMPRRGDLDMNQHVNNVTYIGWMIESLPAEILNTMELFSVTLEFRRECKHDDTIDSLTSPELPQPEDRCSFEIPEDDSSLLNGASSSTLKIAATLEHLHLLSLSGSGMEINRGRTVWRRKANNCKIAQNT